MSVAVDFRLCSETDAFLFFLSQVFADRVSILPPRFRRLLLVLIDALLLLLSVWTSFWLRLPDPSDPSFFVFGTWLIPSVLLYGLPLYFFTGQYKGLTRYVGSSAFYALGVRNCLLVLLLLVTGVIFRLPMPPSSSWILLLFLLERS